MRLMVPFLMSQSGSKMSEPASLDASSAQPCLTQMELERLKLAHSTAMEQYRALRSEYNQNVVLINTLLGAFYTGLGVLVTILNATSFRLTAEGFALIGLVLNCFGFAQLHFLRTNLSILDCSLSTIQSIRSLVIATEPHSKIQALNEPIRCWECAYVKQVDHDKAAGIPVIIGRYAMPYLAGLICFGVSFKLILFREMPATSLVWSIPLEGFCLYAVTKWAQLYCTLISELKERHAPMFAELALGRPCV